MSSACASSRRARSSASLLPHPQSSPTGAPSTSATPKPSVKPESIKAAVNGGAYSVTVEGATLSIAIPSGFTEQRFDTAGLVGVGDSADNGRNINFWIDQSGLTAKESELLKLTREQTSANEVEEVRSVPSVPSVAGHKTAARELRRKDGKRRRLLPEETIAQMAQAGLFGIERNPRDHAPEDRADVDRIARELGLAEVGSSDYHGTGKPNRIGENTTDPDVIAELIAQGHIAVVAP